MGARGPLAQTDNVRYIRGNPGHRESPKRGKLPPGLPNPPTWLDREARAEWKRIVPELERLGILAKVDRAVLAMYCDAWSRWVDIARRIREDGTVVAGYRGVATKHPGWQIYRDAQATVAQLAKECGCSPNARLRMSIPEVEDDGEEASVLD